MKKTLLMAAVLVIAACGPKKTDDAGMSGDTAAMAPAATDTAMGGGMAHDSTTMSSDSTMARDTTKK
jgi:hypothetical protein